MEMEMEPFVLRDLLTQRQWPPMLLWNPDYMAERFSRGKRPAVRFGRRRRPKGEILHDHKSARHEFADFGQMLDWMMNGSKANGHDQEASATVPSASSSASSSPSTSVALPNGHTNITNISPQTHWAYLDYKDIGELLDPDDAAQVDWVRLGVVKAANEEEEDEEEKPWTDSTIWIGTPGAYTPCHYDTYGFNLHAQIRGHKRWLLFPPGAQLWPTRLPYEESSVFSSLDVLNGDQQEPRLRGIRPRAVTLGPGDLLFVPPRWWHSVQCVDAARKSTAEITAEQGCLCVSVNKWFPVSQDRRESAKEALLKYMMVMHANCGLLNPREHICLSERHSMDDLEELAEFVQFRLQHFQSQREEEEKSRKKKRGRRGKDTAKKEEEEEAEDLEEDGAKEEDGRKEEDEMKKEEKEDEMKKEEDDDMKEDDEEDESKEEEEKDQKKKRGRRGKGVARKLEEEAEELKEEGETKQEEDEAKQVEYDEAKEEDEGNSQLRFFYANFRTHPLAEAIPEVSWKSLKKNMSEEMREEDDEERNDDNEEEEESEEFCHWKVKNGEKIDEEALGINGRKRKALLDDEEDDDESRDEKRMKKMKLQKEGKNGFNEKRKAREEEVNEEEKEEDEEEKEEVEEPIKKMNSEGKRKKMDSEEKRKKMDSEVKREKMMNSEEKTKEDGRMMKNRKKNAPQSRTDEDEEEEEEEKKEEEEDEKREEDEEEEEAEEESSPAQQLQMELLEAMSSSEVLDTLLDVIMKRRRMRDEHRIFHE